MKVQLQNTFDKLRHAFSGHNGQMKEPKADYVMETDMLGDENNLSSHAFSEHLRQLGYREAGASEGSPEVMKSVLARIQSRVIEMARKDNDGQLKFKEALRLQMEEKAKSIEALEQDKIDREAHKSFLEETQIPGIETTIAELEDERSEIIVDQRKSLDAQRSNPVEKIFLWIFTTLGALFIYAFYVTASYAALMRTPESVKNSDTGQDNLSKLLETVFVPEAFTSFNFHWFVPIAFFIVGFMLHTALDIRNWTKWIFVPLAITAVIAIDGILAFKIESHSAYIKSITMDNYMEEYTFWGHAVYDPMFYIILILGSAVVVSWSIVVHKLKEYYDDYAGVRVMRAKLAHVNKKIRREKRKIAAFREEIKKMEAEILKNDVEIQAVRRDIVQIEQRHANVSYSPSQLSGYLAAFWQGWMQYISCLNDQDLTGRTVRAFRDSVLDMNVEVPGFLRTLQIEQGKE